jgi:hypothetical protein
MSEVLTYLEDCYAFNGDPAIKRAMDEIKRLIEKCDKQAMILRRLTPENHPDTLFISDVLGKRDVNNMPEKLLVVPAYGVDFAYIYERTEKTTGPEW